MKTKRIAAILLALAITFSFGTGCAKSKDSASASQTASDSEKAKKSDVLFSHDGGFYGSDIELELSCKKKNVKIYYTTDGSEPDENSAEYTQPIKISDRTKEDNLLSAQKGISADGDFIPYNKVTKGTVIRAVAVSDKGKKGDVITNTYFVGIDREDKYGSVPVISISTDFDNLFDYEKGIYVLGKSHDDWLAEDKNNRRLDGWKQKGNYSQKGRDWERPVSVELFTADGSEGFAQDMGMRIMGAASRNNTQKSLRLVARNDYGKKSLKYEIIPDNSRSDGNGNVEKYKSIVLRNGGNDCNYAKIRDPYLQSLVSGKGFETIETTPCVVFINGEYWGMYTITEDYSAKYIQYNYDIPDENVVMVKCGEIEEGEEADYKLFSDMFDFITGNDMTNEDNYKKACDMLDVQGFADYCAFNIYINNEDGIFHNNNWRMWRVRDTDSSVERADGKWRMMCYDTDFSTGIYSGSSSYNANNLTAALNSTAKRVSNDYSCPADIFTSLFENEQFKQMFVISLCDMRNISFSSKTVDSTIFDFASDYMKTVPDTFARFGPSYMMGIGSYYGEVEDLQDYLDGRYSIFMYNISDSIKNLGKKVTVEVSSSDSAKGNIIMNTTLVDLADGYSGIYFTGYPVTVTAAPSESGKFVRWECENCEISDENAATAEVVLSEDCKIKAVYE